MRFWMYLVLLTGAVMITHLAAASGAVPGGLATTRTSDQSMRFLWLVMVFAVGAASRRIICGTYPG